MRLQLPAARQAQRGGVETPHALEQKYPKGVNPRSGVERRHPPRKPYSKSFSTSLPITLPCSSSACALRRLALLIGLNTWLSVVRSVP